MRAGPPLVLVLLLLASGSALAGLGERDMAPAWQTTDSVPRVLVDGVISVPPSSSAPSAYNKLQAALLNRQATGTPFVVALNVTPGPDGLRVQADWVPTALAAPDEVAFTFRLIATGTNESRFHVFESLAPAATAREGGGWRTEALLRNGTADMGVVVTAQNANRNETRFEPDEVVQSAAWAPGDPASVRQTAKSVFFEYGRPASCEECRATDEALRLLATQRGWPADAASTDESYLASATPGWRALLGLGVGAAVAAILLRRRA